MRKKHLFQTKHQTIKIPPGKLITLGFLALILVGALFLWLPISNQQGNLPFIDALFVATSAVCVTGLSTVTVSEQFTSFGQCILLLLIEIGGLGFMSVGILFLIMLRKKISFSSRLLLKDTLNIDTYAGVVKVMMFVLKISFIIQSIGALLLSFVFIPKLGLTKGLFFSIFHAVSAFCNAGFDLFGDSLVSFTSNPLVLLVISALIIAGGLGFLVWLDLIEYRHTKKITLHTKLALTVTLSLLLGGFIGLILSDWQNPNFYQETVKTGDKLLNFLFLAVTPRTAGFFNGDYLKMSYAGLMITMLLMFIGGTSGSTAGGLKTTTFGVLLLQVKSVLKGRKEAEFRQRTIPIDTVMKAFVMLFLYVTLVIGATLILFMTETVPEKAGIEYILFEVISAVATVGLSMGLTPELTVAGKIIVMCLMFIGRVGIFTVLLSLTSKENDQGNYRYPKGKVIIG
ncbi:TrkH family potassium uptake protein [Vagococcus intermedius]|uniref:TrkH family potassium uptake protein n=1 Tax=Vagococcus intermedius TaxID=2991418 RepID=A0AAF0I795_9ENTE|nr:TrkH family potassium uptake protein [Vagococcus intermedius]WEG72841.1 TrkH family potassium uptake protein [Vagococcus intermedius]WEG74927.1 TrkH family potassium uptake protein [Vagococcus intermedius]